MGILTDKEILKAKLSGSYLNDRIFLLEESERLAAAGDTEAAKAAAEMVMEIMPDDVKDELYNLMYVEDKRMDVYHREMLEAMNSEKPATAMMMAEKLYSKITGCYKNDGKSRFVCLKNEFEENIYQLLFNPTEILNKAPFDFTRMLTDYGYMLLDMHHVEKAVEVLNKAIEYNPVDCGSRFELAEVYKFSRNHDALFEIIRETIEVASSPYALARCYCNLGYYCVDRQLYDDAAVFYYISLIFAPNQAVEGELKYITSRTGKKIKPPSKEDVDKVFEKYGLFFGANKAILEIASQLAELEIQRDNIKTALYYLKILYGLTNSDEIRDKILKYEPITEEKTDGT